MTGNISGGDVAAIIGVLAGALGALGGFTWTMFRIARGVSQINRAVNHQGPDEPVLIERVKALADAMAAHDDRATETRNKVAALEMLATSRHIETRDTLLALSDGQDEIRKGLSRLGARVAKVEAVKKAGTR